MTSSAGRQVFGRMIAIVGFSAIAVGTFMESWGYSGHPLVARFEFLPVVIVGALTFIAGVIRSTVVTGSRSKIWSGVISSLPTRVGVSLAVVLVFGVGNGLFFVARRAAGGGSPQYNRRTGHYALANHGSVEVVSKSTYDAAVLNTHQLVLGFGIVFACVGAALSLVTVHQSARAGLIADPQRPLSPDDVVTVAGSALTALDPTGRTPHRAQIIADALGLHVTYRGRLNTGLRETNNSLLPPHLRRYDWSASWTDVTRADRTSGRSFVITCGEQKWIRLTVSTDHTFRRVEPFLLRTGKITTEHPQHAFRSAASNTVARRV